MVGKSKTTIIFSSKQSEAVKIRTFTQHQLKLGMIIRKAANSNYFLATWDDVVKSCEGLKYFHTENEKKNTRFEKNK